MVFYNENLAYKNILSQAGPQNSVLKTDVGYTHAMHENSNKYLHVKKCKN